MAENKTQPHDGDINAFLGTIEQEQKQRDSLELIDMMQAITGAEPIMWGPSIIGFGKYHYKYDSGREGDFFLVGFSPRKQALSLYIMGGFRRYEELMRQLGKFKTGKACLYINKLDDIDRDILRQLVKESVQYMNNKYNTTE